MLAAAPIGPRSGSILALAQREKERNISADHHRLTLSRVLERTDQQKVIKQQQHSVKRPVVGVVTASISSGFGL